MSSAFSIVECIFLNGKNIATKNSRVQLYPIIINLLKYERYFYKTQKKSNFDILEYLKILLKYFNTTFVEFVSNISFKLKVFSKYYKDPFYITIPEILDRLIIVNKNPDIKSIVHIIPFNYEFIGSIKHTVLFYMIGDCLADINIIKNIPYMTFQNSFQLRNKISNYIEYYILRIIFNISDHKFINDIIEVFKKIIYNLITLNYYEDIVIITNTLFECSKYPILNEKNVINFCNILLKYIKEDLNILETIEYNKELKFLHS